MPEHDYLVASSQLVQVIKRRRTVIGEPVAYQYGIAALVWRAGLGPSPDAFIYQVRAGTFIDKFIERQFGDDYTVVFGRFGALVVFVLFARKVSLVRNAGGCYCAAFIVPQFELRQNRQGNNV